MVPDVTPDQPFGPAKTPQAEQDPNLVLITLAPDPSSTRQLIRLPDHPEPLPADVPAPNLIATRPTFKAPPALPPRLAVPPPLKDIPPPPSVGAPASPFPELQAIIVGLNPTAAPPPPGSRSGQIAKAPDAGIPSSGASLQSAATIVPGLVSHGATAHSIPDRRTRQEIVLPGVNRTMSAPLRPSSRVIPASVEAIFARRDVYTLVIPAPTLPGYSGDWVMWFAERQPEPEAGARISAPVPARKYSIPDGAESSAPPASPIVQLAAMVDKSGHLSSIRVLRGATDPALRRRVLDELGTWEFKPALRNGEPMDVDIVLEIPFNFQPTTG